MPVISNPHIVFYPYFPLENPSTGHNNSDSIASTIYFLFFSIAQSLCPENSASHLCPLFFRNIFLLIILNSYSNFL